MRITTVEQLEAGDVVLGLDGAQGTVQAVTFDAAGRLVLRYEALDGAVRTVYRLPTDEVTVR